jgi:dihydrofolate synthase/folylpolyglutamate synthase
MPTYAAALASLLARAAELSPRRKFDPADMRTLAAALGDPQKKFASILIAGTNGKGSTAATLAAILQAANIRTGLYTSPHLSRVNERIRVPDLQNRAIPIADEDFAQLYFEVDEAANRLVATGTLPQQPSFFETVTALAFLAFATDNVQIAVLEVGLGGRLDATNIVDPLLSILTDIDMDHTEWLGPTLTHIAREKAGILRQDGLLVTLPQHPEANQVIGEVATALNVTAINAADYLPYKSAGSGQAFRNRYTLEVAGEQIEVDSPLSGQHQQRNIALAIAAAVAISNQSNYKITPQEIAEGIRETKWPARLELLPSPATNLPPMEGHDFSRADRNPKTSWALAPEGKVRPTILLDVAHNPAGAWTLRAAINALESDRPESAPYPGKTLLFGCLADKPADQLAQILFPLFDEIILTRPTSPRAADPTQLATIATTLGAKTKVVDPPPAALEAAIAITPPDGLLVLAGSVYLVGELRPRLVNEP